MGGVSIRLGDRLFDTYHAGANVTWQRMRSAILRHAWVELYEGQKDDWIRQMDDPSNLSSRVWFTPFEQVIELRYERYYENTFHLCDKATFVIISDFDSFWGFCPGADQERWNGETGSSIDQQGLSML